MLQQTLHMTHFLKLFDKMYKYGMDPTRTVGVTERTRDVRRTDGPMDGLSENNIPPTTTSLCEGYKYKQSMYEPISC